MAGSVEGVEDGYREVTPRGVGRHGNIGSFIGGSLPHNEQSFNSSAELAPLSSSITALDILTRMGDSRITHNRPESMAETLRTDASNVMQPNPSHQMCTHDRPYQHSADGMLNN